MDMSLTHLKKFLKFGIVLAGIPFVDLKSCFGVYTPSSLKDKKITWEYISNFSYSSHWTKTTMVEIYGSEALVNQAIVPSTMLDSKGFFYTLVYTDFSGEGIYFCLLKYNQQGQLVGLQYLYPWHHVNNNINCLEEPHLDYVEGDQALFKNFIHNAFQPCIAQEVGEYSDYLYVFAYVPPLRFCLEGTPIDKILKRPPIGDDEGILMLKINKESMNIVSQEFYSGKSHNDCRFDRLRPRRIKDNHAFNLEYGNFTAWVDKDSNNNDHVHLAKIISDTSDNLLSAYYTYNGKKDYRVTNGYVLNTRAIKHNTNIYKGIGYLGIFQLQRHETTYYMHKNTLTWFSPFEYIDHSSARYNDHTSRNHDFCIVDNVNESNPIFCILGLRATSETDNSKTSLSGKNNERWTSKCINEPSKIVLILSSYAWNGTEDIIMVARNDTTEDPQNIIYSTGKTTAESCTVDCGCYSNTYDDYGDKQLFKNTHKLVTYTSESGSKYIIYCYCYPGKSKQLFLGYAPYYIANNKVHLLTKTEFKTPPSTDYPMGESFGNFTSCSRIISMDLKNGQLWITWIDKYDAKYYSFHIAAKDLVGE